MRYRYNYLITTNCNYDCYFCSIRKHEKFSDKNTVITICEFLTNVVCNMPDYDKARVNITGGEPTLHPNLIDAVKILAKAPVILRVYTNLSASVDIYTEIIDITGGNVEFDTTYHNNHADYTDFYNKLKYLLSYDDKTIYGINYNLGKNRLSAETIYDMFNSLCGKRSYIFFNELTTDTDGIEYKSNTCENIEHKYTHGVIAIRNDNPKYHTEVDCHITNGTISSKGYLYHCHEMKIPVLDITRNNAAAMYKRLTTKKYMCEMRYCCFNLDKIDLTNEENKDNKLCF